MKKIERALISVTDKTGVAEFARALHEMGVEIVSTGGTARVIREAGVPVTDVSEVTGFPEMLDGRVKTLHPKIHGGLLFIRDKEEHVRQIEEHGIKPIDLVAVNLYAFEKTVASGADLETAIENIDIGGPTLLRAAAKNFKYVTVIVDPADYERVLSEMRAHDGATTLKTRFELARKVFETTSGYDRAIAEYLARVSPPEE
ncbi:IMP cyclohydrolase [Thermosulfurimonas sp. F29]|uniref:IMP cyclohydrolase n=1 Tax=Thermosulfurimonas sp. F29 TaxID=2867247 RepID=UPI001C839CC6|nr:IMP cyclohydrolase [Thermosulfurimonas sp. F29]MBX6423516.1 IMP cyclohydrolase [Thermosulfurimonas sp. F29]